uniref:Uncharacterized protein n=1 Tax=Grammatophora oceanica TaxID=210454 RepID=A0A7S1YGP2_9STRA|mmetsp:Transcript_45515/g.67624  ORF Transcript_45515/g.67624 Transcript_45515/m.67624 type:complete len:101 (+) Transcript_45515:44-346(+)
MATLGRLGNYRRPSCGNQSSSINIHQHPSIINELGSSSSLSSAASSSSRGSYADVLPCHHPRLGATIKSNSLHRFDLGGSRRACPVTKNGTRWLGHTSFY